MTVLRSRTFVTAGATIALAAAGVVAPALSASAAPAVDLGSTTANPVAGQAFQVKLSGLEVGTNYRLVMAAGGVTDTTDVADSNSCASGGTPSTPTMGCTLTEGTKGDYTLKLLSGTTVVASKAITVSSPATVTQAPKFIDNAGADKDTVSIFKTPNVAKWTVKDASGEKDYTFSEGEPAYKDITISHGGGATSTDVVVTAVAANGYRFTDGSTTQTFTRRITASQTVPEPLSVPAPTKSDPVSTKNDTLTLAKVDNVTWTVDGNAVNFGDSTTVTMPISGAYTDGKKTVTIVAKAADGYTFENGESTKTFTYEYTDVASEPTITRVAGDDRAATSVEVAKKYFPGRRKIVYVANGLSFPDALASGPAAAQSGAPLLLSQKTWVSDDVLNEIKRMVPEEIRVVGGADVVSTGVAEQLGKIAKVNRVAGGDRYDTAVKISQRWSDGAGTVYIANGLNFPDALSGGAGAAFENAPLLLTNGTALSDGTAVELRRLKPSKVVLVGGDRAVNASVARQVGDLVPGVSIDRAAGDDRYETSALVMEHSRAAAELPATSDAAFLATGLNFPDALAGTPAAFSVKAPLGLTMQNCVPKSVQNQLEKLKVTDTVRLGSKNVIGDFSIRSAVCG